MAVQGDDAVRVTGFARRLLRAANRFRRDEDGASVIEFALVGPIFLAFILLILETGSVYWVDRVLQSHATDLARRYRTAHVGTVTETAPDGSSVERDEDLCRDRIAGLMFDCSQVRVDVRQTSAVLPLIDAAGNFIDPNFDIDPGASGTINIVRVHYNWPRFLPSYKDILQDTREQTAAKGFHTLYAAAGFVTE